MLIDEVDSCTGKKTKKQITKKYNKQIQWNEKQKYQIGKEESEQ
jgi:hypothetical protein